MYILVFFSFLFNVRLSFSQVVLFLVSASQDKRAVWDGSQMKPLRTRWEADLSSGWCYIKGKWWQQVNADFEHLGPIAGYPPTPYMWREGSPKQTWPVHFWCLQKNNNNKINLRNDSFTKEGPSLPPYFTLEQWSPTFFKSRHSFIITK